MALTILVTGFGPFPGAPVNPTGPLVQSLAQWRMGRVKVVTHIFPASYAAVDRDLPKLIARYRPDALLMFGLAPRSRILRIETRAQNALAKLADAAGKTPRRHRIESRGPAAVRMPAPAHDLLAAVRGAGVRVRRSRDAGQYLCNYLCWRATEATRKTGGPKLAAFIHVPLGETASYLARAGRALLKATAAVFR
jgi:pyroglutamyl-peptidase